MALNLPVLAQEGVLVTPWKPANHDLAGMTTLPRTLTDITGKRWHLDAMKGQVVLINFWASWCPPCLVEMPSLAQRALQGFKSHGVVVLTVNFKESEPVIRGYLKRNPLTLPIIRDPDGKLAASLGVRIFPTTLVLAPDGQMKGMVQGELDWRSPAATGIIDSLITPQHLEQMHR